MIAFPIYALCGFLIFRLMVHLGCHRSQPSEDAIIITFWPLFVLFVILVSGSNYLDKILIKRKQKPEAKRPENSL